MKVGVTWGQETARHDWPVIRCYYSRFDSYLAHMEDIVELIKENNRLLKEIRALLLILMYDENYIAQQDMKAFSINVTADIFVEMMENNPEFKDKIKSNFL